MELMPKNTDFRHREKMQVVGGTVDPLWELCEKFAVSSSLVLLAFKLVFLGLLSSTDSLQPCCS
jgi:hypothetical protein